MTCTDFALGCHCPPCLTHYLETYAHSCTYGSPSKRRYSHAVPEGSSVALCGRKASTLSTGETTRCPDCERFTGQRNYVTR